MKEQLMAALRSAGIYAETSGRAKELDSFLKKAIRKQYADPWDEIVDKAGVRAVVRFIDDVQPVCNAIRATFRVVREESKADELEPNEFGYLGVHFDIIVEDADVDRQCEIQVQTACQNVWATLSHLLAYKTVLELPKPVLRSLHRASALLESADIGFDNSRNAVITHPEFKQVEVLTALEKHFFRFVGRDYDAELSLQVINCLLAAYQQTRDDNPVEKLEKFVAEQDQSLRRVYHDYANVPDRSAFLFQPEAIAIFERLEVDRYVIQQVWTEFDLPYEELSKLSQVWGIPLDD